MSVVYRNVGESFFNCLETKSKPLSVSCNDVPLFAGSTNERSQNQDKDGDKIYSFHNLIIQVLS